MTSAQLQPVLLSSRCLYCLPPQQEHVIAIEGHRAVSLRMSLEKHVGDNDGARGRRGAGGGREEKKKKVPRGLWGPAKQLNGCKQHHSPHVQTFKISARVMGSAWPLSGCTKHRCSFPSEV